MTGRPIVVHIGSTNAFTVLFDSGRLIASRSLPISDTDVILKLTRPFTTENGRVQLDPISARDVRSRLDLRSQGDLTLPGGETVASAQLIALIRPDLERLALEIAKFVRSHTPNGARRSAMGPIWITGDGAALQGIEAFLEREIHIEASILEPLAGFTIAHDAQNSIDLAADRHRYALALGHVLLEKPDLDLTPASARLSRVRTLVKWGSRLAAAAVLALFVATGIQANDDAARIRGEVSRLGEIVSHLKTDADRALEVLRLRQGLAEEKRRLKEAAEREAVIDHFQLALRTLPEGSYLDRARALERNGLVSVLFSGELLAETSNELAQRRHALVETFEKSLGEAFRARTEFSDEKQEGDLVRVKFEAVARRESEASRASTEDPPR